MKRLVLLICLLTALSGCYVSPYRADGGVSLPEHSHSAFEGPNVLEHEPVGYCGNTMTTVCYQPMGTVVWSCSFAGGDSVGLSDLLRFLDYSGDICRCLPDYMVDTEFGTGYGISLSEGYVRHGDGQVQLTREQWEEVERILTQCAPLCGYPLAPEKEG